MERSEEGIQWMSPDLWLDDWDIKQHGEPPIWKLNDLRLPQQILTKLTATGILPFTPMHCQALRAALSCRRMLGISFTGPGKTLLVVLPLIMTALQGKAEGRQGPFALAMCSSPDMALNTYQVLQQFLDGYPHLKSLLCVEEENDDMEMQVNVDIIVATPRGFLASNMALNIDNCRYLSLDRAEFLCESPLRDDLSEIFHLFKNLTQTVVFCESETPSVGKFARDTMVNYVCVDAGTVGFPWLNMEQEVKYVKNETEKLPYILETFKTTNPPVLIFCKIGVELECIYKFLVSKGAKTTVIHGYMSKQEREDAISSFKFRKSNIMLATDAASEELWQFRDIYQVINYSMPSDIESYFRRVSYAGKGSRPGKSMTFIDDSCDLNTLLQLKQLLKVSRQWVPPALSHLVEILERPTCSRDT